MAERRPVTYPVTVDTIGKLIDLGMRAFLSCPSCGKTSDIDLHKVAEKVGRDWVFIGARWPCGAAAGTGRSRRGSRRPQGKALTAHSRFLTHFRSNASRFSSVPNQIT